MMITEAGKGAFKIKKEDAKMAEERVYKTTEAQRRATAKRMAQMDSLSIWLKPEEKTALKEKAAAAGMSMTAFIKKKCGI